MENNIICVITRYREKITWLPCLLRFVDRVIIYNKGDNQDIFNETEDLSKVTIIDLPNLGRIDHTIAYHITKNWDNLPDKIIFIPASIYMCKFKGRYFDAILITV